MDLIVGEQSIPPEWSLRFSEYFQALKSWILGVAYPALVAGPLKSDPGVALLPTEIARIEEELARTRPIPIALVGLTGVGKSTLLNALLEQDLLPVGVIGSQTAAFVTMRYAPVWEVVCDYIEEGELVQIFQDAATTTDETSETGSPELREKAERKIRALLGLKDDASLPAQDELINGPPPDLIAIVKQRRRVFSAASDWKNQLQLHAKEQLWPITKTIDVRGPFEMLRSGVVISDLPGTGDLNKARSGQAASAVRDAGQIIIATDGRLLQTSLTDQLEGVARLPHRLFAEEDSVQVVLVGTSLDKGVPNPEEDPREVQDLGLDPATANDQQIFAAISSTWASRIRALFNAWLKTKAAEFLPEVSEHEREILVERIMNRVAVVPTSAKDWARHIRKRPMRWCQNLDETGIPELRKLVNELADAQIKTTVGKMAEWISSLRETVLSAVERSEGALGVNIQSILDAVESAHHSMQEVQERQVQTVEDLRLTVLDRFRQIRETLSDKIENAALKMAERGRKQVQEHLDGVHWASLRATIRNDGIWLTSRGRSINLRDAMGGEITRLVPQAWSRIADQKIAKELETAKTQILNTLDDFTSSLESIVYEHLDDDLARTTVKQLFQASRRTAKATIDESARRVSELLGQTSKGMQEQVDEAVSTSLGSVCDECWGDSGTGWRLRSVARIVDGTSSVAEMAQEHCAKIAEQALAELGLAVGGFCETAASEMTSIGDDLPVVLRGAIERSRLTTPQEQRMALRNAVAAAPPAVGVP